MSGESFKTISKNDIPEFDGAISLSYLKARQISIKLQKDSKKASGHFKQDKYYHLILDDGTELFSRSMNISLANQAPGSPTMVRPA